MTKKLFGLLNVQKPRGLTSRKAVDHVKRLVNRAKIGHAGTLDPLAEGVLIICIGQATRLVPYVHELPKSYRGEFLLGRISDTDDVEGMVQEVAGAESITSQQLLDVLPRFVGRITQTPPVYSAVKIGGRRAYKLARQGRKPDVPPREVDVHRLELSEFDPPRFVLEIDCGSGTYIRSLGRDIAQAVGSHAVMSSLIRTQIGPFDQADAVPLEAITYKSLPQLLSPAAMAVSHLTTVPCNESLCDQLRHGLKIPRPAGFVLRGDEPCAVVSRSGKLVAICEYRPRDARIAPRQVFA